MQFLIASTFKDSLTKLQPAEQSAAKLAAIELQMNRGPSGPADAQARPRQGQEFLVCAMPVLVRIVQTDGQGSWRFLDFRFSPQDLPLISIQRSPVTHYFSSSLLRK